MARTTAHAIEVQDRRRLRRNISKSRTSLTCRILSTNGDCRSFPVLDFNSLGLALSTGSQQAEWFQSLEIAQVDIFYGTTSIARAENHQVELATSVGEKIVLLFRNAQSSVHVFRIDRILALTEHPAQVMVADIFKREVLSLRVENFSSTGMLLSTSASNRHILPGMIFKEAQLFIPHVGLANFDFKVVHCSVDERLSLGVQFVGGELNDFLLAYGLMCLSQSLDSAHDVFEALKKQKLDSKHVSHAIRIEVVSETSDYQKVLDLRLRAYNSAGKIHNDADPTQMADDFDQNAVIFIAKVGGIALGTARIVMDGTKFPMDQYFPNFKRNRFRGSSCEISRLAVDPSWQRTDLLVGLFKSCFEYIAQNNIENVYCVSTDKLKPLYRRLGARQLERGNAHPVLKNEKMNLMLIKKREYITCQKMSAHAWEVVAAEVIDHLAKHGFIEERISRPQIAIKKMFEKFILKFLTKKKEKKL